ncbi:HAMP domain-containing sensor histidine kinase [Phaeodactylibacter sp.]|uniref:sensor histidine kinase n=1 Tax=Phaeodactylibacter sp. TaxID=1940289 RepID=UPI0025CE2FFA|nr:HAMP domain-containing sensor histidine kinase [Phaeodactylibacter sp.]MCI4651625.1 HAMP domain-containing histidine kinase [Phaeodactylibacter sp.]MCI5090750.1 HAMP domain-containing histidine kinase [Phaeodactylibacter sp.]
MNKKAIWAIIGLMSAAVLGVVILQMDLIRTAVAVNEERFEKNIYAALNAVTRRLETEESQEVLEYSLNGFQTAYYQEATGTKLDLPGNLPPNFNWGPSDIANGGNQVSRGAWLNWLTAELLNDCNSPECRKRKDTYRKLMVIFEQSARGIPLEERIKLKKLDKFLKQELSNRGIDTEYSYGVFSREKNSFIIADGHYVVEDDQPKEILPGFRTIFNSRYKVDLFPEDTTAPGMLMIHFPQRTSFVWRSLWLNFLGSIIFTTIILFCFAYTINVIFRQKKLSSMKTDFINNMTHEFKTPIATISLAADSITSPMIAGKADKVGRFANIIKQENKRMNSQVEKVLQMALIDKKDFSLKVSDVNLHDIIYNAVENIGLQVEKKDGKAWAELEASNPMIEGDNIHISNIINNLLDNANKYSPDKPEISVHTRNVPNGVEVTISDKGIGMNKEQRKHIFDKFYRVHTGDVHDVKGFGLGLSYVKAMMTAHQGQIDVKSELGKGSSFTLFFPYKQ